MGWMSDSEKERNKRWKREAKEARERRGTAYREFSRLIMSEGLDPEAAKLQICERYSFSPVEFSKVLSLRRDLDPTTVVDMDATIQRFIGKGKGAVDAAWENLDEELEKLDLMEEAGLDGVVTEAEETTGERGTTVKLKKQPINEARMRLMEKKLEVAGKFMDRLASIAGREAMAAAIGKTKVVVNIDATEEFRAEFARMRGLGNEKVVVVDVDTVTDGSVGNGE